MNLDSLSLALSQITYLVSTLSKKNYKQNSQELAKLIAKHGLEADRHLLRCLFSTIDEKVFTSNTKNTTPANPQAQLLLEQCIALLNKPTLVSNLCFALENPLNNKGFKFGTQFFLQLARYLRLNAVQEVAVALALKHSSNSEISECASVFVKNRLPTLVISFTDSQGRKTSLPEGGLHDTTPEVLHLILTSALEKPREIGISQETIKSFIKSLQRDFPREHVPIVLAPLLYSEDIELTMSVPDTTIQNMDNSLADMITEMGYKFTSSLEDCKKILRNFGGNEITSKVAAHIISAMCRYHTTHDNGNQFWPTGTTNNINENSKDVTSKSSADNNQSKKWNFDVFIQSLKELSPNLSWAEVVSNFDHPEFIIKDQQSLNILMSILQIAGVLGHPETFPIARLYKHWNNIEGQFSLMQQILKHPDCGFSFADYPFHSVCIDSLKSLPEMEANKEIATWKSLNLVDLLLYIADRGLYPQVQDLFKYPLAHCPDILIMALLQIQPPVTVLRQDLLTNLIPIFLPTNHPNSTIILHNAWHCQNINVKTIIMHSMADWYIRGDHDQTRLSRILDIAQDLKALSMLLNVQSFPFIIDLACLASRREYLKLEKWLTDKIREHGEKFIQACVKFLQRRCPQIVMPPGTAKLDLDQPKAIQLPNETLATMISCLQSCIVNTPSELNDIIMTMVTNCAYLIKSRQAVSQPPNVLRSGPHRPGLDTTAAFNPTSLAGQLFNAGPGTAVEPLLNLGTNFANINLGENLNFANINLGDNLNFANVNLGQTTGSAFNVPNTLGPLVSTPGSPSKVIQAAAVAAAVNLAPPSSPFPLSLPIQTGTTANVGGGAIGATPGTTTGNLVSQNIFGNAFSRMAAAGTAPNLTGLANQNVLPDKPQQLRIPDSSTLFPDIAQNLPREIEDEANSYFQRIYNTPTLSIEDFLDMLAEFKSSQNEHDRDVFQCMLKNLFEEYKFFPQYPERELQITAQLFGGIIERDLISNYMLLGMALRYILDALRKPVGTKMYYFGIVALDRFKSRLKNYHKYCEHVRAIQHFTDFPPHLIEYVEYGLQSMEPPNKPTGPLLPGNVASFLANQQQQAQPPTPTQTPVFKTSTPATVKSVTPISSRPSIANATNIDTLLVATEKEEKLTIPPETVQDKTAFIFNNLSQLNLQQKCDELRELVTEEFWPWISQYLVMKRASIEVNFHVLYSNFLDSLKISEVNRMVTKETFRNIKVLLRSDKGIANFGDRLLLKNLGHWLGMLTLARNKPILRVDLDLKSLLVEAYHNGQQELLYVVPFVAKVLESCAKSKVFKPPNPWTMAIMNVLAELHQEPELKLNLKFEIEVLCKNLSIDVADLKPTVYLKDPNRLRNLEYQMSQPTKKDTPVVTSVATSVVSNVTPSAEIEEPTTSMHVTSPSSIATTQALTSQLTTSSTPVAQGATEPRFSYMDIQLPHTNAINPHNMIINNTIQLFQTHPQLKQLVRPAIERAIQEWIGPVVERSVKIATTTCENIVRKDFALDPEETRLRSAAHHMIRNLTAGMALTTCRDQLLTSISSNIKTSLMNTLMAANGGAPPQKEVIEQVALVVAHDNMELACAIIQKTAIEKSLLEIDKQLMPDYEVRQRARAEGRRYCDTITLTYQAERMPEPIRLKVGGVTPQQMTVYEEFAHNIPGFLPISNRDAAAMFISKVTPQTQAAPPSSAQVSAAALQQVIETSGILTPQQQAALQAVAAATMGANNTPFIQSTAGTPTNSVANVETLLEYEKLIEEVQQFIQVTLKAPTYHSLTQSMHGLLECLIHVKRTDMNSIVALIQRAVENLQDNFLPQGHAGIDPAILLRYRDIHIRVLKCVQERSFGVSWAQKTVTRFLTTDCRDDNSIRLNLELLETLIRARVVNVPQLDYYLSQCIDNGNNFAAITTAMHLIQVFLIEERANQYASEGDFSHLIEILARMIQHVRPTPEGLVNLMDMLRQNHNNDQTTFNNYLSANMNDRNTAAAVLAASMANNTPASGLGNIANATLAAQQLHSSMAHMHLRENEDPPGMLEKTEFLLREWVNLCNSPNTIREPAKGFSHFVTQMNMHGILKTDDLVSRFIRICTQYCVDLVYRYTADHSIITSNIVRAKCFHWLDSYVKLISLLIKHSGDSTNITTKVNLLIKVLNIIALCLEQDHEIRSTAFQQLPYQRIINMLYFELNANDPALEGLNNQVLNAFYNLYHELRPSKVPGFCYAWLELISNRVFIARTLGSASALQPKLWSIYAQLLLDLFKFLAPFLRNAELAKPVTVLYRGTLRVLLVLLHDFPEFLCDYHYNFCDVIPSNCIQMRNIILSAFPRTMRLPDPFTPNLKVEILSEIAQTPRTLVNFGATIQPAQFKNDLDSYLKQRAPVTFLSDVRGYLQISNEPGMRYNISLINALVMYVGTQAIQQIRNKNLAVNMSTISHSAHMDIFQNLAVDLDTEGRYLFFNAIANQLRFPNTHTYYFLNTLLYLFVEANAECIQEQITRVLLERLIVNRPHPWGLLVTFVELIKNPNYKFWNHEFVHCASEIEKLLQSVAHSCMAQKSAATQEDV